MLRCRRECPQEIYIYVCVCMLEKSKSKWIYSVSGSNIRAQCIEYFSRYIVCKRITAQRNRIRLDFEIRNVSLRLVTDHEDRVHECTRDDNIKMHERAFSRRVGMFLTREAQFVARFTQITARILPCSARDHAPKSIYSISKMYNGYANTYLSSLSLSFSVFLFLFKRKSDCDSD